jgi:3-methylcrotonyl-CoA carboxylase alpha subunit
MIAKLIAYGEDREQALRRLDIALEQCHLAGIQSNVAFLRRLVRTRAFGAPDLDTALIEREHAALFEVPGLASPWIGAAVLGWLLQADRDGESADPLSRRDSFRLHGVSRRRLELEVAGQTECFWLEQTRSGARTLAWRQERLPFAVATRSAHGFAIRLAGQEQRITVYAHDDQFSVFAAGGSATVRVPDPRAPSGAGVGLSHGDPVAPMPGKVIAVLVEAGQSVAVGAPVAVIEAMKMEHTVVTSRPGRVMTVRCAIGDQIDEGEILAELQAPPEA